MSWTYLNPVFPSFLMLALIGTVSSRRMPRLVNRLCAIAGLAGCILFSWMPVAWLVSIPLECWFRPASQLPPAAEAIVVLAGDVYASKPDRPFILAAQDTFERCRFAAWLYNSGPRMPILAAGGPLSAGPASQTMRALLISMGVPAVDIWIETNSRSTHENAVFGSRILRQHDISRIALVTEARFMLRAAACFRKEGMEVTPMAFEFTGFPREIDRLLPGWEAIQLNNSSIHEFGGLLWYRLHGWV